MAEAEIRVGDLKWGKVDSHPWWPGVIYTHPIGKKSKKKQKNGIVYHFHFLSNPPTWGWVKEKNIRDFRGIHGPDCQKGGMFYCPKPSFQEALQEAEKAWSMTNRERTTQIRQTEGGGQLKEGDKEIEQASPVSVQVKEEVIDQHESPGLVRVKQEVTDSPLPKGPTYILGKTKIPLSWQTPYVLIDFKSVPENLTEDGYVKLPEDDEVQNSPINSISDPGVRRSGRGTKRSRDDSSDEGDDLENEVLNKKQKKDHSKTKAYSEDNLEEEEQEKEEEEVVVKKEVGEEEELGKEEDILSDKEAWEPGDIDSEDDLTDFEEILENDDEDDDDWIPGVSNENDEDAFITKKRKSIIITSKEIADKSVTSPISMQSAVKESLPSQISSNLSTSSLKTYLPPTLVQGNTPVRVVPPPPLPPPPPTQASSIPVKLLLVNTSSPTTTSETSENVEPEVGDFLIEKAECLDGNVPFLWRYKKGGLIQKYDKMTLGKQTFFQNVLNFSDWWSSAAHKYQKVDVRVIYKYKCTERVVLADSTEANKSQDLPETTDTTKTGQEKVVRQTPDMPETPEEESAQSEKASDKTQESTLSEKVSDKTQESTPSGKASDKRQEGTPSEKTSDRMQEEEVSSTTPDSSDFQVGSFVLDKKDERNTDGFPIWKIESSILLRKFEAVVKQGKLYHQPMKTYRGYKSNDIAKFYTLIKVRSNTKLGPHIVEVPEEYQPKVVVDSSMEEEYDKHPLLRHFYIYLQVFLSQALEPGFLESIKKNEEDNSFTFSMGEIDKIISQKVMNVERKVRWALRIKKALKKCPFLREVYKPDSRKQCEALEGVAEAVEENVFLFGPEYDLETLKISAKTTACQDFKVGPTAVKHICTYHKLCHFKFNLYEKCTSKIKLIRERKKDADVTEIMDSCLGNKAWVLQNFEDFMTLVEMFPCT